MNYGFHWHHINAASQNSWKDNNCLSINKGNYLHHWKHF